MLLTEISFGETTYSIGVKSDATVPPVSSCAPLVLVGHALNTKASAAAAACLGTNTDATDFCETIEALSSTSWLGY